MNQSHKIKILIWFAALVSLLVYLLLAWYAASQIIPKEITAQLTTLQNITFSISAFFLLAGFAVPAASKLWPKLRGSPIVLLIIQLALFEICGLSGMLFTVISGHTDSTLHATLAAFVGMLSAFPRDILARGKGAVNT